MFHLGPDLTLIWKKNVRCSHSRRRESAIDLLKRQMSYLNSKSTFLCSLLGVRKNLPKGHRRGLPQKHIKVAKRPRKVHFDISPHWHLTSWYLTRTQSDSSWQISRPKFTVRQFATWKFCKQRFWAYSFRQMMKFVWALKIRGFDYFPFHFLSDSRPEYVKLSCWPFLVKIVVTCSLFITVMYLIRLKSFVRKSWSRRMVPMNY